LGNASNGRFKKKHFICEITKEGVNVFLIPISKINRGEKILVNVNEFISKSNELKVIKVICEIKR